MEHYTYAHVRNDTGQVFYIGKGSGRRAWSRQGRSQYWHRVVDKHGYTVQMLAPWATETEALQHEILLIECMRDLGMPLCNATLGGEGANGLVHSIETKQRIAQAQRGRSKSAETRAKLSAAHIGRTFSSERVQQMSDARKGLPGHPHTAETKAKIAAARIGKPGPVPTAETLRKRSASMKATIARKRAAGIEPKPARVEWTPERRAAMAETIRRHWATIRGAYA